MIVRMTAIATVFTPFSVVLSYPLPGKICAANKFENFLDFLNFHLTFLIIGDIIYCVADTAYALVAQLDRVFDYESKGQGFESLRARQAKNTTVRWCFFVARGIRTLRTPPRLCRKNARRCALHKRLYPFGRGKQKTDTLRCRSFAF